MKYHTLLFLKIWKMSQNLSSAAVVIGALRVKLTAGRPETPKWSLGQDEITLMGHFISVCADC